MISDLRLIGQQAALVGMMALALLVTVWGVEEVNYRAHVADRFAVAADQADKLAIAFEEHISDIFRYADLRLATLRDAVQHGGLPAARRWSNSLPFEEKVLRHMAVGNAEGVAYAVGGGIDQDVAINNADRDFFAFHRDHSEDVMFVSPPSVGRFKGDMLFRVSRRIDAPDGSFAGLVVATLQPELITDFYKRFDIGPQGSITLVRNDRMLIARRGPGAAQPLGQRVPDNAVWQQVMATPVGAFVGHGTLDGVERLYAHRALEHLQLVVLVGIAEADVVAASAGRHRISIAAALVASLLVVVGALAQCRQMAGTARLRAANTRATELSSHIASILDTSVQGIVHVKHRTFVYANRQAHDLFGYDEAELVGANSRMLYASDADYQLIGDAYAQLADGAIVSREVRMRRKDGSQCWCRVSGKYITPADPAAGSIWGLDDITDRKCADLVQGERSRLTQRQYENLRSLNHIAALPQTGAAQQLTAALALGLRHLGLPVGLVSRAEGPRHVVQYSSVVDEDGPSEEGVLDLGTAYSFLPLQANDVVAVPHMAQSSYANHPCYRTSHWECYTGAPIMVRGRPYGTVSFGSPEPFGRAFDEGDQEFMRLLARWIGSVLERDLSEQDILAAKEEAEAARRRSDLILSSVGEGICGVDAQGDITFINPAALRMLGWAGDGGIGLKLHATIHHSHADGNPYPAADCPVLATLRDGAARQVKEDSFWRRDGTAFPVQFTATAVFQDSKVAGAVIVFRDITESRAAERALIEKSQELVRSNAELEQFAYVASHDLRQPLRSISSYVALLGHEYADRLDDTAREFIEFARSGAERMDRLIVDLLEYSRIGRKSRPMADVALADVLEHATLNLSVAISDACARVDTATGLPVVRGSHVELVRLFQNLVGNALKYRDRDRTPIVAVHAVVEGGACVVTVKDNGIGIAPEHFDRIFGIFQRLHGRDEYEGTGIGLAVSKRIVEHHKGRIWLDSTPGQGSAFHVALPMTGAES